MSYNFSAQLDDEEADLPLSFRPVDDDEVRVIRAADGSVHVGYLVLDEDPHGDYWDEQEGFEFSEFRGQNERDAWIAKKEAEGRVALIVDNYRHGNDHYSLAGTANYPDRRWDVAPRAVLVLDDHLKAVWDAALPDGGREAALAAVKEPANALLNDYSRWRNGEVYGVVAEVFRREDGGWKPDDEKQDACWGYVGHADASSVLAEIMSGVTAEDGPEGPSA